MNCTCNLVKPAYNSPNWTYTTTGTNIFTNDIIQTFDIFDVQDNSKLESSLPLWVQIRDAKNGIRGTLDSLKISEEMKPYFISFGTVWQIVSPLLFKVITKEKPDESNTHFVTTLSIESIEEAKQGSKILQVHRLVLQEVTDNFTFLRLLAKDSAYRKSMF